MGSGLKVGVVDGEFRTTPHHHRRRGALDRRMVSLPDLTLTIREERRNQNQMRGREQQRRLGRRRLVQTPGVPATRFQGLRCVRADS